MSNILNAIVKILDSMDRRPEKGRGVLDRFGAAAALMTVLLVVFGVISAAVTALIMMRQAGRESQLDVIREPREPIDVKLYVVPTDKFEQPVEPSAP